MLRFLRRCVTNDALRRSKSTSVAQRCEIQTKEAELGKASEKLVFFRNISGIPKPLCEILVAFVFGLENLTFLAKSDIFIPKCNEGDGGVVHQVR